MDKLLLCPFCGKWAHAGHHRSRHKDDEHFLVMCAYCFARTVGDTAEEAIAAWNRRTKPENKPLTLDELRQMDGEPVWMARAKKWVFVSTVVTEPYAQVWYFFKGFVYTVLYYHEKFYRNKPERSEG